MVAADLGGIGRPIPPDDPSLKEFPAAEATREVATVLRRSPELVDELTRADQAIRIAFGHSRSYPPAVRTAVAIAHLRLVRGNRAGASAIASEAMAASPDDSDVQRVLNEIRRPDDTPMLAPGFPESGVDWSPLAQAAEERKRALGERYHPTAIPDILALTIRCSLGHAVPRCETLIGHRYRRIANLVSDLQCRLLDHDVCPLFGERRDPSAYGLACFSTFSWVSEVRFAVRVPGLAAIVQVPSSGQPRSVPLHDSILDEFPYWQAGRYVATVMDRSPASIDALPDAEETLVEAISLRPDEYQHDDAVMWLRMIGRYRLDKGGRDGARRVFEKALRAWPESVELKALLDASKPSWWRR